MFNDNFKVKVREFLGRDFAHNPEDGEKIINYIFEKNKKGKDVDIDFKGIVTVNTAFCNVIYESLKKKESDYKVKLVNCNDLILETFNRVKDNFDYKALTNDL